MKPELDCVLRDKPQYPWLVLGCYVGSIAHGTYRPSTEPNSIDDKDVVFAMVEPLVHYLGTGSYVRHSKETIEIKQPPYDIVIHEFRKLVYLMAQGNPNVLMILWNHNKHFVLNSEAGRILLDSRDLFVGRHVYHSFSGYAHSQLHRMTNMAFDGYMGEKRKALVEKHGYDTKNASHLVRLLRMGIEFLVSGELHVERPDREELLDIKDGKWSLEKVQREADVLFRRAEDAYAHSILPPGPDHDAINEMCMRAVLAELKRRGEV